VGDKDIQVVEYLRLQARVEEFILTGLHERRAIGLRLGISVDQVHQHCSELMAKWVGERPKKNRDRRLLLIAMLNRLMFAANTEFEKSKRPGRKVVTEYRPETCSACEGTGKRGRRKCKACEGKGTITKERITKTVEKRLADPSYLQLAIACVREIARLEGLGQKNRRSKAEVETDRHLHLHLNEQVERWRDAPDDLLLEAKCLADRLSAIRKPVRKAVAAPPIGEPV
jgi:hypothetical protein